MVYLRRHAAQDPLNPRVIVRLMEALNAEGDLVAALQQARVHEELMRQELELPPDPAVTALVDRLRKGSTAMPAPAAPVPPVVVVQPASDPNLPAAPPVVTPPPPAPAAALFPRRIVTAGIVLGTAALALLAVRATPRPAPREGNESKVVVAIGPIVDYSGLREGTLRVGRPLTDMLATNLARSSGFRVISNGRMLELLRQLASMVDSTELVSAAARQAGAAELIDGALYEVAPDHYRLDIRRVDLSSGAMIRAYTVRGSDLFALVDSGTMDLVGDLGGRVPPGSVADISTRSIRAYDLYEQGLDRYFDGDRSSAELLFRQALYLDSTFAQAAFYYARSTTSGSRTEGLDRLRRAVQLAEHAGDRERLIMEGEWASANSSPALPAIAETLMVRYPDELSGYVFAGVGAVQTGQYLQAVAPFRRVIALDSLANPDRPHCPVCSAYAGLLFAWSAVDSLDRVRQTVHEWVRHQPASAEAWRALAAFYAATRQADSALAALRTAEARAPNDVAGWRYLAGIKAILEDYAETERLLRGQLEMGPPSVRDDVKWSLAVTLRQLGRLQEARVLAHEYRVGIKERLQPGGAPYNALLEGQILFEQGHYRAAALLFDSIAVGDREVFDSVGHFRDQIWAWVHEADALAQLGDTARLMKLADKMETLGRRVGSARERSLHAHVRGLLARLRGRDAEAEQWFRQAMLSPVIGFVRTNLELGRIYLRTGQSAEAIRVLTPAAWAGTIGPRLYVTRTEVEGLLGRAFEAAGQADSALFYYQRVLDAWSHADPEFAARRDSVTQAVARLRPPTPPRQP